MILDCRLHAFLRPHRVVPTTSVDSNNIPYSIPFPAPRSLGWHGGGMVSGAEAHGPAKRCLPRHLAGSGVIL
jgi:hypothetical protein